MRYLFQVAVHVINKLIHRSLTLHMHGMFQKYNVWMDGVPFVTQCPIMAESNITYRFYAEPIGTHWYHSHYGTQRADGTYGMLIVQERNPTTSPLPSFLLALDDWVHITSEPYGYDRAQLVNTSFDDLGPGNYFLAKTSWRESVANIGQSLLPFHSILVNGRGRQPLFDDPAQPRWPLEVFTVSQGGTYRFRVVNAGKEMAMRVSVDQHMLTIAALDSHNVEPFQVESFFVFAGETFDFLLDADQPIDKYWIRFSGIGVDHIPPGGVVHEGRAIISYESANDVEDPVSSPISCSKDQPCLVFNCASRSYPEADHRVCMSLAEAHGSQETKLTKQYLYGLNVDKPDKEIFMSYLVKVNGKRYISPIAPFSQKVENQTTSCDNADCDQLCKCTNIVKVKHNEIIQFVFNYYNTNPHYIPAHPIHLHGTSFAVLKMGFPRLDNVTGKLIDNKPDIICDDEKICSTSSWRGDPPTDLNLEDPPLKHTVVVPPQGYVVVRFRAVNPGYWMMHCHNTRHEYEGMASLVQIGDDFPDVPPDFPECNRNFDTGDNIDFENYMRRQRYRYNDVIPKQ